jgi:RecB family exonuclease
VPLKLILGPPNSGRADVVHRRYLDALERDPVLVVPTVDDVFAFERELCGKGAALGGSVLTFGALFGQIATAGGSPPGAVLSPAQRQRCVEVAVEELTGRLGPLRRSAVRPGFATAFARLLDELQAAGVGPRDVEASAGTLEGSAYLADVATLFAGYEKARGRSGRLDAAGIAREAIALLRADPGPWAGRPVYLYGLDDLTPAQFDLVEALVAHTEVTVAVPFEPGNEALVARGQLLGRLRERLAVIDEETLPADPANTGSAQLYALARGFGFPELPPEPPPEPSDLTFLRSAGTRAEAEAIAAEVSRLVHGGAAPDEIAVALRDPGQRGPEVEAALEANGIAAALEAEVPVVMTSVGGAVVALLEIAFGTGRAADLLRYLRGPSGFSPGRVDWLERAIRRDRIDDAEAALARWRGEVQVDDGLGGGDRREAKGGERRDSDAAGAVLGDEDARGAEGNGGDGREAPREDPRDLARLRDAAAESPAALCAAVAGLAGTMASRPFRTGEDGPRLGPGDGLELRAAGAIAAALTDLAALGPLAPAPERLAETVRALDFRVWSGPVEGRVRIASPYRLRAARFDHVLVGSLQDGEFPRRDRGGDPFLSEAQREQLGLDPRRDTEAEERYLFAVCLALPRRRLFLSYRDSDENGAAESRSPLLEEVRATIAPPPPADGAPDPVEAAITRERGLADVVAPLAEAPSADELARALAAHGPGADPRALLAAVGVGGDLVVSLEDRLRRARRAEHASRAPGPLTNPAVLASLAAVEAYGGTTLEGFDECSYRWFAGHELDPQPLDPVPDPLVQGGLIHAVLERLYRERPGGDPLPRSASLDAWIDRGRTLLTEQLAEREVGGHPAERAMARRVERLLERYLGEEAARETGGFEPWLLEARFGIGEEAERPSLNLGGWGLHGAIDRIDRAPDGRALVHDYKLAASVTARDKFEERAKLQLPLYLLAAQRHWGAKPVGGIYHPLRGTSNRRPRGVVAASSAGDLSGYDLYRGDVVEEPELEELLEETRRRGGAIVARIRAGEIRRDPGPREGLRGHDVCPTWCSFASICRRDRAPSYVEQEENEAGWER